MTVLDFIKSQTLRIRAAPSKTPRVIVAIPANNEADRIEACLAALATQRDCHGQPAPPRMFEILLFVNNSTDSTAAKAMQMASIVPHPIIVVERTLGPEQANAGFARKAAMDLAAERLDGAPGAPGFILTTDADSLVPPTWVAATLAAFATGVDCVAGYIDAQPSEIIALGASFLARSRLEDRYISQVSEMIAVCDPDPDNPWPNHRVSSGASLAVTLDAYRAIGGLPSVPVGEDIALTRRLEAFGYKVRHTMDVYVLTSCRLDGRAKGGAADTMQYRHAVANAPCDDDIEPAFPALKRAILKGRLRHIDRRDFASAHWFRRLGLSAEDACRIASIHLRSEFSPFWQAVEAASPVLARRPPLHPSDLPREIRRAEIILSNLRRDMSINPKSTPADMFDPARSFALDIAQ